MMRATVLLLFGIVAVALVATPGLAAVGLLVPFVAALGCAWWIALGAGRPGNRSAPLRRTRHHELLGPGGPDDPFADEPAAGAKAKRTTLKDLAEQAERLGYELRRSPRASGRASASGETPHRRRPAA
jgi:hypothetical protein